MPRLSFTAQLRAIDDANLDPYQFRMVMHFWRVGKCFESLRTTADKCGMSLGKASQVKQWLLDNGWIEHTTKGKRMAVQVCSPDEQRSPDEQERSPHEQIQPDNVHHMNAILNEPLLNEPLLNDVLDSDFSKVIKLYENNIGQLTPIIQECLQDDLDTYPTDWITEAISIAAKNNAKSLKYIEKILYNWKTEGKGSNGRYKSSDPIVDAWLEVKEKAAGGTAPTFSDSRILKAVGPLWPEVKKMTSYTEREIRMKFERNYNAIT